MIATKICIGCGVTKSGDNFCKKRNKCNKCRYNDLQKYYIERARNKRLDIAYAILHDCRSSDKKHGYPRNDLTYDFIKVIIKEPCIYCGASASEARMTLDRINNTIGHLKNNVVAACYRCNLVRGDMPYAAWLIIAPAMREARRANLFNDWMLHPKKWVRRDSNP